MVFFVRQRLRLKSPHKPPPLQSNILQIYNMPPESLCLNLSKTSSISVHISYFPYYFIEKLSAHLAYITVLLFTVFSV